MCYLWVFSQNSLHGPYGQRRYVEAETEALQTIPWVTHHHCLKRPQWLINMQLQVSLVEVKNGHICPVPPPLTRVSKNITVG